MIFQPRWHNGTAHDWKSCFRKDPQVRFLVWAYAHYGINDGLLLYSFCTSGFNSCLEYKYYENRPIQPQRKIDKGKPSIDFVDFDTEEGQELLAEYEESQEE